MTGSHSGTERRRSRRRGRVGSFTALVALFGALLVTAAGPARALSPCSDSNNCPVANEDDYNVNYGVTLSVPASIGLLANDEGPASTHVSTAPGDTDTTSWNGAKVTVKSDGSFTYKPDLTDPLNLFSGQDSFDYTIVDSAGDFDFDTAYINVIPVVRNDSYSLKSNQPLNIPAPGLVGNDGGIDPDSLVLDTTSAHNGTIVDNSEGAFTYTPAPGFSGTDTFHYTGTDLDFDADTYQGTVTIYIDGTPPTIAMTAPGPVTLGTKVSAAWTGNDGTGTGVASYDTQYEIAPWNAPFGPWAWLKIATTSTSDLVAGTYGRTFCFRARAKDRAGNYSALTAPKCSSIPLRSSSLVYSKLWNRVNNAGYFGGQAFTTTSHGQNFVRTGVQAQHIWLVATTCASCGTLDVRWNNVVIKNISLVSPVTVHHALIGLAGFTAPQAGTLRLDVTSATGRPVIIEGLAVLRA